MATIDMRPQVTPEEPEEHADEEVKETSEQSEAVEENREETSASEEQGDNQEEEKNEEPVTEVSHEKVTEGQKAVEALELEKERIRREISDLRTQRREVRGQSKEQVVVEKTSDELNDVSPQDVELIEKVLRAKGFVKKDELQSSIYQDKVASYQDKWLETHPEYLPANDPEDKNWNLLRQTIDTYFRLPSNPREISKVLDMAHGMIKPSVAIPVRNRADVNAAKEKLQSASRSAAPSATKSAPSRTSELKSEYLIGFTDEEVKEILG